VRAALRGAGRPEDAVTAAEVKFFCKHASTLRVCRWRTLAEEAAWVWPAKYCPPRYPPHYGP